MKHWLHFLYRALPDVVDPPTALIGSISAVISRCVYPSQTQGLLFGMHRGNYLQGAGRIYIPRNTGLQWSDIRTVAVHALRGRLLINDHGLLCD